MNKITILALGAVFAVSMIAITAFEVEAVKPTTQTQEEISTGLELTPLASSFGTAKVFDQGVLFFGDTLCDLERDAGIETVYIKFATDTLVQHNNSCFGPTGFFDLEGDVDANFKKGDVLVVYYTLIGTERWVEVHREQTI